MRMTMLTMLAGLLVFGETPAYSHSETKALNPQEAYELGVQAYLYGYPLVLMTHTYEAFIRRAPINQFQHAKTFPNAGFRSVVRPNADTLYSAAWLDLSREPIVMSVPDTRGRYYLVQMLDAWTETFAAPGARTTGTKAGQFAIVGPTWRGTLPPKMTTITAPTNLVWLIGRIQTNGPNDYPNVQALQRGFRLAPLSAAAEGASSPSSAAPARQPDANLPPPAQVARMDAVRFFTALADAMQHHPPHADDARFIAPFSAIGLAPGKPFDDSGLDDATKRSLMRAVSDVRRQLFAVDARVNNGWRSTNTIGRYGTDYLSRAVVARTGLGALPADEAIYLSTARDADGRPLSGANAYVLHFAKDALPPVNAFWSLTLYDADGYFVPNTSNRYAIGDRDHLRFNQDGSLDVYVQQRRPSDSQSENWLPAPGAAFNLSLRLYWPKPEVDAGRWTAPSVRRYP